MKDNDFHRKKHCRDNNNMNKELYHRHFKVIYFILEQQIFSVITTIFKLNNEVTQVTHINRYIIFLNTIHNV